jgi:putative membrane protein
VPLIANIVVGLIALLHVYILVLEMFFWDKPAGLRAFGQTQEAATASKVLAANQGRTTASWLPVCFGGCRWEQAAPV